MDREFKIEKCKEIDIVCMPENNMTKKKIDEFYKDIDDEKLSKIFEEYYGDLSWEFCILCGKAFCIGEDGNELGFCITCQEKPDFPYDLEKYYKDYDNNKVAFKGFDTMSRGLLEPYRKDIKNENKNC
jgi:hypothetical protein